MQRFMKLGTIGAAAVLALGMVGFAAADGPPDPHPACENAKNPPPGCEENGRPGDPDDGEDPGDPGDPGADESPLAALVDLCDQVVDELSGNIDPQLEEARQLCDALRDDEGDPDPDPGDDTCEEEDERPECQEPDEDPSPLAPIVEGCDAVVDGLSDNLDPQLEEARQLCDALRGDDGPGEDPGEEPCEEGDERPQCQDEPEPEPGPQDQIADGCDEAVDTLADSIVEDLREAKALCDGIRG